jgi:hypothetical protein
VIQGTVDVRGFNRQQAIGAHQPRRVGDNPHRHGRARAAEAPRDGAFF